MRFVRAWLLRFGTLFNKRQCDREFAAELESHLEMHIEDNVRAGMTPAEARRQALIKLGGMEQTKEDYRERRGILWLENLLRDVRFGLRMLRKSPGFTIVAILTLTLGIGANTAIFSVVNAVLLQPLPYPHADRLVELMRSLPGRRLATASIPKFIVWRDQTQVFQNIAAFDYGFAENLTSGDRPEQVQVMHVSASYFALFNAPLAMGRTFTAAEDQPGAQDVAVISNELWQSHFGGNRNLFGETISLGGKSYELIGVLDSSFVSDPPAEAWLPLQADPNSTNQAHNLRVVARLESDATLAQAQAAMKIAAEEFRRKFPVNGIMGPQESATAITLRDFVVGDVRLVLLVLLGAVGLVLLISCANMANLLLSRSAIRKREIAIRAALGAERFRILSQLLTESILLSLAGGVFGLVIGYWGVRGLLATNSGNIPRIGEHGSAVILDWRILVFTLSISLVTGILFGAVPAIQNSRIDLAPVLNETGSRAGTGLRQSKSRSALVITQVALAMTLLTGALLLIRTLVSLRTVNPGFELHNILTMQMRPSGSRFEKTSGIAQFVRDGEQRIRGVPGVEDAAVTADSLPLTGRGSDLPFVLNAHPSTDRAFNGDAQWRVVSPGYFDTFRIPLLRGRLFNDQDDNDAGRVVVISEEMAREFWPQGNPVGDLITIGGKLMGPAFVEPPRQIIGVVADVRDQSLKSSTEPTMYVPIAQMTDGLTTLFTRNASLVWEVRTKSQPYSLSADIQQQLYVASGGLPVTHIRSMDQVASESTAREQFNMLLLSIFAVIALLLAAIGIYGLVAYSVQQRTHEIGIRMALGAQCGDVLSMVLRDGLILCLLGIVIGIAGAFATTRLLKSLIFGVSTTDSVTFVGVAVLLAVVALLACYVPARRAMRVDPMVALRHE